MSEIPISASATALPKRRKRSKPPPILHVYDRRRIMARAWQIARERGLAIGPAQKIAWSEAKGGNCTDIRTTGTLTIVRHHGVLPYGNARRLGRVWPLLIGAARWLESRFIPERAA